MRMFQNVRLFAGLTPQDLATVAGLAVTRNFPANEQIIREGEVAEALYVVLYGRLKVYVTGDRGAEVLLNIFGTGECFGEMALMDDSPRSASVATLEASRLAVITKADFKRCLSHNADLAFNIIRSLNRRVRTLTGDVKTFALLDVSGRVLRALVRLAAPGANGLVIEPRLTHQQISQMVGASREMVTRVMRDLSRQGHVRTESRRTIISPKAPLDW